MHIQQAPRRYEKSFLNLTPFENFSITKKIVFCNRWNIFRPYFETNGELPLFPSCKKEESYSQKNETTKER